jgi:hypothetical protein
MLRNHKYHNNFAISFGTETFHDLDNSTIYETHLFLFDNKFDRAGWIFMPRAGRGHWVLAAVDLKCTKMLM